MVFVPFMRQAELIKAAPLRSAAPGNQAAVTYLPGLSAASEHGGSGHPDRAFRCPDLSTTARMASSMAAVIRQLPAASAKRRSVPEMKGWRGKQGAGHRTGEPHPLPIM